MDLGSWLGEAYRVPDATPPELEDVAIQRLLEQGSEDEWPSA